MKKTNLFKFAISIVVTLPLLSCNGLLTFKNKTKHHNPNRIVYADSSNSKKVSKQESLESKLKKLSEAPLNDQTLRFFNTLSKQVDGEYGEWFNEIFFERFHKNPETILIWIYNHKNEDNLYDRILEMQEINEDSTMMDESNDELSYYPSHQFVTDAIKKIKENKIKKYLLHRLETFKE